MEDNIMRKIWKDPVGSTLISASIIGLTAYIWGVAKDFTVHETLHKITSILNSSIQVKLWIIILCTVLFIRAIIYILKKLKNNQKSIIQDNKVDDTKAETIINTPPTAFFEERFCDAFPGLQWEYKTFTSKKDIKNRLTTLLAETLHFDKANGYGVETKPLWWFKGRGALAIVRFTKLNRNKFLMNNDELIIEKIIAVKGSSYYRSFVYVQCKADISTGLYDHSQLNLEAQEERGGTYTEEFAIFKNEFIKREEYDDGSTIIRGKPIKTTGAELRTRSLIRHNFIICAKYAPYNCPEFSKESRPYFKGLLNNEISFDTFTSWMSKLPKNPLDN